jgi:hypothetical protein
MGGFGPQAASNQWKISKLRFGLHQPRSITNRAWSLTTVHRLGGSWKSRTKRVPQLPKTSSPISPNEILSKVATNIARRACVGGSNHCRICCYFIYRAQHSSKRARTSGVSIRSSFKAGRYLIGTLRRLISSAINSLLSSARDRANLRPRISPLGNVRTEMACRHARAGRFRGCPWLAIFKRHSRLLPLKSAGPVQPPTRT